MHYIQRKIFQSLRYSESLKYSQMRPENVESNHFAYHLEQLINDKVVEKNDRNYSLTIKGQIIADRASHKSVSIHSQPHIVVAPIITNDKGQDLLYKHNFQPYIGLYGPPQGRLEYDDKSVIDAAYRELQEKTGLQNINLEHRGVVYITARKQGVVITKMIVHVFTGRIDSPPELADPTNKGGPIWGYAADYSAKQCMPGYKKILHLLQDNKILFFDEFTVEM